MAYTQQPIDKIAHPADNSKSNEPAHRGNARMAAYAAAVTDWVVAEFNGRASLIT